MSKVNVSIYLSTIRHCGARMMQQIHILHLTTSNNSPTGSGNKRTVMMGATYTLYHHDLPEY